MREVENHGSFNDDKTQSVKDLYCFLSWNDARSLTSQT